MIVNANLMVENGIQIKIEITTNIDVRVKAQSNIV